MSQQKFQLFEDPIFKNESAARKALEAARWPAGQVCPHCGNSARLSIVAVTGTKKSHRNGLYYCNACGGQFTVTVGTVLEGSKISFTKWWKAAHLFSYHQGRCSVRDVQSCLNVTYKTAWFMVFRLREVNRILHATKPKRPRNDAKSN